MNSMVVSRIKDKSKMSFNDPKLRKFYFTSTAKIPFDELRRIDLSLKISGLFCTPFETMKFVTINFYLALVGPGSLLYYPPPNKALTITGEIPSKFTLHLLLV